MTFIEVSEHRFINTAHIVEFTYTPTTTEPREKKDPADHHMPKTVQEDVESHITIIPTVGEPIKRDGSEADSIYRALKQAHGL